MYGIDEGKSRYVMLPMVRPYSDTTERYAKEWMVEHSTDLGNLREASVAMDLLYAR